MSRLRDAAPATASAPSDAAPRRGENGGRGGVRARVRHALSLRGVRPHAMKALMEPVDLNALSANGHDSSNKLHSRTRSPAATRVHVEEMLKLKGRVDWGSSPQACLPQACLLCCTWLPHCHHLLTC